MVNTNYKAYRPKAYLLDQIPNKKKKMKLAVAPARPPPARADVVRG